MISPDVMNYTTFSAGVNTLDYIVEKKVTGVDGGLLADIVFPPPHFSEERFLRMF